MPNGNRRSRPSPTDFKIDAADVEKEIKRNRKSNERFLQEYSEWFDATSQTRPRKRKVA